MCTRRRPGCELSPLLLAGELSLGGVHAHVRPGAYVYISELGQFGKWQDSSDVYAPGSPELIRGSRGRARRAVSCLYRLVQRPCGVNVTKKLLGRSLWRSERSFVWSSAQGMGCCLTSLGSSINFQFQYFTTMRLSVLCWFFADAAGLRRHQSFAPARPRSRLAALALPLMWWVQPAIAAYSCCAREAAAVRGQRCGCCCAVAVAIVACRLRAAVRARRAAAMCRLPPSLSSSTNGAYGGGPWFALLCGCCCCAPVVAVAACPRTVRVGVLLCAAGSVAALPALAVAPSPARCAFEVAPLLLRAA